MIAKKILNQVLIFGAVSFGLCENALAIGGASYLFPIGAVDFYGETNTFTDTTDWPEVVIIGAQSTITFPFSPFVDTSPINSQPNTPLGGIVGWNWVFPGPVPGLYTVDGLHGYIDDDGTTHTWVTVAPWIK